MSIKYQTNNIIHSLLYHNQSINLNIEYNLTNSLYDLFIQDIEEYNFIEESIISYMNIPYGLTMVNNPMMVADNVQKYMSSYANKILFFHSDISPFLKKEDIYLINKSISRYKIYSFIPSIVNKFPSAEIIKYGFGQNCYNSSKNRTTDITILYTGDAKQSMLIKDFLSKKYSKVDIMSVQSIKDKSAILDKLNDTKICIDIINTYNTLLSISCGCYGITNSIESDNKFLYSINDINNLYNIVDNLLSTYDDSYIELSKKYISTNYNYNNFKDQLINIVNTNYKLPVVL